MTEFTLQSVSASKKYIIESKIYRKMYDGTHFYKKYIIFKIIFIFGQKSVKRLLDASVQKYVVYLCTSPPMCRLSERPMCSQRVHNSCHLHANCPSWLRGPHGLYDVTLGVYNGVFTKAESYCCRKKSMRNVVLLAKRYKQLSTHVVKLLFFCGFV